MDGDVIAIAAAGAATQDGTGNAGTPAGTPVGQAGKPAGQANPQAGIRHKKLQDFFVDAKVPKHLRDEIDLLAYGNRILWVLPSPHFAREDYRKKGRFSAEFRPEVERAESSKAAPAPKATGEATQGLTPEPTQGPTQEPAPKATGETTQGPAQALTQGPAQALTQDPAQALTQGPAQEPVPAPAPKATGKPEAAGAKAPAGGRNNAPETILVLEIL